MEYRTLEHINVHDSGVSLPFNRQYDDIYQSSFKNNFESDAFLRWMAGVL